MSLPPRIARLFHNYRPERIDLETDARWIILTVLREGDWEDHRWLFRRYGRDRIAQVVRDDLDGLRTLSPSVANFWSIYFWGEALPPQTVAERWRPTRLLHPTHYPQIRTK